MYSLWIVQWDFTRRDHLENAERVSGSGPVNYGLPPLSLFCNHFKFCFLLIMTFFLVVYITHQRAPD